MCNINFYVRAFYVDIVPKEISWKMESIKKREEEKKE